MKLTYFSIVLAMALLWAPYASADDHRDPPVDRQVMVRLAPGFDIEDFNAAYGTTTIESIASRNIHLLELPGGEEDEYSWLEELLDDPPAGLVWAELNYAGQAGEGRTGSFFVSGIRSGQRYENQWLINRINLRGAHQQSTGQDIVVAVLDTGIDATHPILSSRVLPNGFNFVDGTDNTLDLPDGQDNDGDEEFDEMVGHGTFMAGLIALVAPDAMLLPVVVLNSDGHGTCFHFTAGLFYAIDEGADVVNMSLGSTYDAQGLKDALIEAQTRGVIVVAAAGNTNTDDPEEHPATVEGVIGVAATDRFNYKWSLSNFHEKLSLAAPGIGIHSTIPRTAEGHTFARWKGTSMSTAVVSGAAALVAAAHPELPLQTRAATVQEALEDSAARFPWDDQEDPPDYEDELGHGLLDADAAIREVPLGGGLATLTDFTMIDGFIVAGGLPEMDSSDDAYLETEAKVTGEAAETHRLRMLIGATTTVQNPATMDITLEGHITDIEAIVTLFLRNWNTGNLEQVGQFTNGLGNDTTNTVHVPNTSRFVRDDGRIELLVKKIVVLPFTLNGFHSLEDLLEITVN